MLREGVVVDLQFVVVLFQGVAACKPQIWQRAVPLRGGLPCLVKVDCGAFRRGLVNKAPFTRRSVKELDRYIIRLSPSTDIRNLSQDAT